jgi:hypothetical protein
MKSSALALVLLFVSQHAAAQDSQPSAMVLAQALDRCMATQAVRLTRTTATDPEIFARARQSCLALNDQFRAAVNAQLPPADAAAMLRSVDEQAEPNFLTMLSRIRSDRARREGGQQPEP